MNSKAFASQADLEEKTVTFSQLSPHAWAYTAEGDPNTGIVIGETAVIGDNVSILQDVTLGGNGKETGDRHPKIGDNVLLAAGAKVLGNIRVGDCSKVAAGSVVLQDVPNNKTVAGVPAKIVGDSGCPEPARSMDHRLSPGDCGCG